MHHRRNRLIFVTCTSNMTLNHHIIALSVQVGDTLGVS
jgi:hypothetical protein